MFSIFWNTAADLSLFVNNTTVHQGAIISETSKVMVMIFVVFLTPCTVYYSHEPLKTTYNKVFTSSSSKTLSALFNMKTAEPNFDQNLFIQL